MARELILASSSPRRQELLGDMGIRFRVVPADVDERLEGEPDQVVLELARRKARAIYPAHSDQIVLAADTLVYAKGQTLGKPKDLSDAERMLRLLSGSWHQVFTGVCLMADGKELAEVEMTKVRFSALEEGDITRYLNSGEAMGKAGAYAIQGRAGMLIPEIQGCYSNVVGLPTALVRRMLQQIDFLV